MLQTVHRVLLLVVLGVSFGIAVGFIFRPRTLLTWRTPGAMVVAWLSTVILEWLAVTVFEPYTPGLGKYVLLSAFVAAITAYFSTVGFLIKRNR